jgi:Reverse transcriptase (RNA-dependent DNA polymerase)
VRSIVNKFSLFELYIADLSNKGIAPDIIFLSETFLTSCHCISTYKLPGYNAFHSFRPESSGGGTAFYIRDFLIVSNIVNKNVQNIQFTTLKVNGKNFCGIYRPPTSINSNIDVFYTEYEKILFNFKGICFGDYNLDITNRKDVQLINFLQTLNFSIINNTDAAYFTRNDSHSSSIIDHIHLHNDLLSRYSFSLCVGEFALSDHRFLLLSLNNYPVTRRVLSITKTQINYKNIDSKLKALSSKSVNFTKFHHSFTQIVNEETTTSRTFSSSNNNRWFSNKLKHIWQLKTDFSRLKRKYPLNIYFTENHSFFKKLLTSEIRKAKKSFFSKKYSEALGDNKKIWQVTNEIINNSTKPTKNVVRLKVNDNVLSDNLLIAEAFNNQFITVGQVISNPILNLNANLEFSEQPLLNSFLETFDSASEDEVSITIDSLKNNVSKGYDSISTRMLKRYKHIIVPPLTCFINEALISGIFPDSLKIAKVTPIFKSGDPLICSNYRPISILPSLSKIFEIIIKKRLLEHLKINKIIHQQQYGFMENSSTAPAASCLAADITTALSRGFKCAVIFIDIVKAFDCVDYKIMNDKLQLAGISGSALNVFQNYFINRFQSVIINSVESCKQLVTAGCAQGSILGPILFLLYINDLLSLKLNGNGRLYADDACFFYTSVDENTLLYNMQHDLIKIEFFLSSINMKMSIEKTKYIIFKMKNSPKNYNDTIHFNNNVIYRVDSYNYLGVTFHETLTWNMHADKVIKSVTPYISLLSKLRHYVEKSILQQIYFAHIHSRWIYCLPVWQSLSNEYIVRFQRLQSRSIKFINFLPVSTPTISLFIDSNLLNFRELIDYENILFIYKINKGLIKCDVNLHTNADFTGRTTRQSNQLRIPHWLNSNAQKNIFYKGIKRYNDFTSFCERTDVNILTININRVKELIRRFVRR